MEFVAPARFVLTELHCPDGDRCRCGRPMLPEELWVPVEARPGDRVCPGCAGTVVVYEQEVML